MGSGLAKRRAVANLQFQAPQNHRFRGGAVVAAVPGAGIPRFRRAPLRHLRVTLRRESASGDANCWELVCKTSERSQTIYVEWRPLALSLRSLAPRSSVSPTNTHAHAQEENQGLQWGI